MFNYFENGIFKKKIIYWLLIKLIIIHNFLSQTNYYLKAPTSFLNIFNYTNKTNTILIFEPNNFHQECTPGYAKYFLDLGYNVDVLIHVSGNESFSLFPSFENIKLFIFDNIDEIKSNITKLFFIIKKYDFILLQLVKFFTTSTLHRNYTHLIDSAMQLKKENFTFEIIITGRNSFFNSRHIPKILSDNFLFLNFVSFSKFYKTVKNSDYIFIPLDPENKDDIFYKNRKATGSAQLIYGFLKPAIINQEFSYIYNFNSKNSLLYNNSNLYNVMKKAILLKKKDYINLQRNLIVTEKILYQTSINNIKKAINSIRNFL